MIVHLRDLERLRELTEPYVTDSSAGYRDDALTRMPAAERGEAEEIIARIGTPDPTLATLQEKLLGLIAEMNVFYRDVLDRERARGADPEDLRQAQEILTALERYRNQITGLKPGDTD
jgi:23S rRNA A2030 N6-methylase RlmJ